MSNFFSLSAKEQQNILRMYEQLNNINKPDSSRHNLSLVNSNDDDDYDIVRSPATIQQQYQSADTIHSLPETGGFSSEEDTVCFFFTG